MTQPPDQSPPRDFSSRRVLVAEDDPLNRQVVLRMLQKLGCHADAAANGREALFMHEALAYELMLMDCQMPELDGYQTTMQLRAHEAASPTLRRTPVIALTASVSGDERALCLAAGMDDFLAKPIHPQALRAMLAHWLPSSVMARAAPEAAVASDRLEAVRAAFGADFAELAALYQRDSPQRIALLRQAAATGDGGQAAKIAHVFGGSCASIGADALAALCRELELLAKADQLAAFGGKLAALEAEYGRVSAKLQAIAATAS